MSKSKPRGGRRPEPLSRPLGHIARPEQQATGKGRAEEEHRLCGFPFSASSPLRHCGVNNLERDRLMRHYPVGQP